LPKKKPQKFIRGVGRNAERKSRGDETRHANKKKRRRTSATKKRPVTKLTWGESGTSGVQGKGKTRGRTKKTKGKS